MTNQPASPRKQIETLLKHLNKGLYEREEAIRLGLLSVLSGESMFLLGRPGVAKSMVARRLKYAFEDGRSFEYLMNRFSTPEEIFGPISIQKLTQEDKYERLTDHYLPGAHVVFLDEIWKAGPSIQNTLLTIINEKVFRNGEQEVQVPLRGLIAASNELPEAGAGLDALWDRFLIRILVEGVHDLQSFRELVSMSKDAFDDLIPKSARVSEEQYQVWQMEIGRIDIPEEIYLLIELIRKKIAEFASQQKDQNDAIYVSDRRWRKIVRLMRTSAFLNGRKSIDLMDGFLIPSCIWNEPEQIPLVTQWVEESIRHHGYRLTLNLETIQQEMLALEKEVEEEITVEIEEKFEELKVVTKDKEKYYLFKMNNSSYLLKVNDFKRLQSEGEIRIKREIQGSTRNYYNDYMYVSKGENKWSISYDYDEYPLELKTKTRKVKTKRAPHHAVVKEWEKQIKTLLTQTNLAREQIHRYKENELGELRKNVFVPSENAEIVEAHLESTEEEISKLEVQIKEIQHRYQSLRKKPSSRKPRATLKNSKA